MEIYDVATNAWSAGAAYPYAIRGQAGVVGPDGLIYSLGDANASSNAYRYNPATNAWTQIAAMPIGLWEAAAVTALNGKIYVFAGWSNNDPATTQTLIYTPATNSWTTGAPIPAGRHGHVAILDATGLIHVIGGTNSLNGGNTALASHYVYNPTTNTWTTAAALPIGANQAGGALGPDGKLYVVGGKDSYLNAATPLFSSVYAYDTSTNTWSTGTSLPIPLGETRTVALGSNLYTVGGSSGPSSAATGTQQSVLYRSAVTSTFTWTGATSTNWNVASNWSGGVVPTAADNVTVPAGLSRYPVVSTTWAAANTVTISSNASLSILDMSTLTVAGNFVNNGTFSASGIGSVVLNGNAVQAVGGSSNTRFQNLIVGAFGAALSGPVEIQRLLTLDGNLTTNGQRLFVLSNKEGSAIVNNNGGAVTGAATVQRYIDVATNPGFGYRHWSPAVSGTLLSNLAVFPVLPGAQSPGPIQINPDYNTAADPGAVTPFPTIFTYNESRVRAGGTGTASFDQGWMSPTETNQAVSPTTGYTINEPAGNVFELVGTLNSGNFSRIGLTRGSQPESGWHLVGNPYPSPIQWDLVSRSGIDAAAYVYRSTGQYDGGYTAYVNGVGTNILPMSQAFFVRVSTAGVNGSVSFSNSARIRGSFDPTYARPAQTETRPLLHLTLQHLGATSATSQDDFYVYEQSGATAGFDSEYDALKVQLNGGAQPSLYQQVGSEALAIQGLPAGNAPRSLALGLHVPVAGTYEFTPVQLLNFASAEPVWLEDKLSGTWHDLQQGTYRVTLGEGLSTSRFVLHLHQARALANHSASAWTGELQVYPNPASKAPVTVVASGLAGTTAELVVVNSVGQHVWQQTATVAGRELRAAVPVASLAQGVYTVQVRSAAGVLTRKLIVQ